MATSGGASAPGLAATERLPNDEAPGVTAEGFRGQGTADGSDCASSVDGRKRFEHLRALLALHRGHVVHELAAGGFLVTWKGLCCECSDLAELEAHAGRVGALR